MARPASRHPTELELEILNILWQATAAGPRRVEGLPVREVRDRVARPLAVTSVTTIMNIMVDKGYLARRKGDGSFIYRPRISQQVTTRRMLKDLVNRAFDGSAAAAMVNLLETGDLDQAEIRRLRELLNGKLAEAKP